MRILQRLRKAFRRAAPLFPFLLTLSQPALAQTVYRWGSGGTFAGIVTGTAGVSSGASVVAGSFLASGGLATTALPTLSAGQYGIVWDTTAGMFKAWNGSAWVNWNSMIGVTGTNNTVAKFTGTNSVGNSGITDDGTTVIVGSSGAHERFSTWGAWLPNGQIITGPTTYTIAGTEGLDLRANASGGAVTINLPAAQNTTSGLVFVVMKTDSTANTVTISRAGSDTIQGAASIVLSSQYDSVTLFSDSGSPGVWYKIAQSGSALNQTLQQVTNAGNTTTNSIIAQNSGGTSNAVLISGYSDLSQPYIRLQPSSYTGGSANKALLDIGPDLSGGSANGTLYGSNPTAAFTGDLIDLQGNSVTRFRVGAGGQAQLDSGTYASAGYLSTDASGNIVKNAAAPVTGGPYLPLAGGTMTGGVGNATTTNDAYVAGATPAASATQSLVRFGNNITGGSLNGTYLGMNANNGFNGNFIDLQNFSTKEFSVASSGAVTATGYATANSSGSVTTGSVLGFVGADILITAASGQYVNINGGSGLKLGSATFRSGAGSPNNSVVGNLGDLYLNTSGGAGTTLWVKESGAGTNTGWVGK